MVSSQQKDEGGGHYKGSSSDYLIHFIVELKFNDGDKYDHKVECTLKILTV